MPLYEYQCEKCSNRFEKIESVSALHSKKCPKCGGKARRLFAAPAIQFKGSGWYVSDYGKGSSENASKEGSGEKPAPAASSDGGSTSKKAPASQETTKKPKKD